MEEVKKVVCEACDLKCGVLAHVEDNRVIKIEPNPDHPITPNAICQKARKALDIIYHPDRLLHPLKRVGDRGSGKWERVTWDQALDDISNRLKEIIAKHGPEALACSHGACGVPVQMSRRFMNLLGSPNWTSIFLLCLGNTTVTSKITYGWYQFPDYWRTKCIVLWGHDPQPEKWVAEYRWISDAIKRGAKLIVIDPRRSFHAKKADIWLQIRPGTDSALALGWLNVIINEGLYDKEFVEKWTVGFDKLKELVQDYSPEKVEEITWVPAEKIREAARMYATTKPAIIPWSVTTDEQANSTHTLRAKCILRAITGNLDVPGGETLQGFNPKIISDTELELNEKLPEKQKKKQLGIDRFKVLSWECFEMTSEAMEKVWGIKYANQINGGAIAHPPSIWTAMIEGKPYPVKAFIADGNNTLMSYTNTRRIYEALKSLDLLVVMDQFMTPTAQLADYVLPATHWLERPAIHSYWDWIAIYSAGEKAVDPSSECWTDYSFWRELAVRMGQEEYWPWKTLEEFYDYRLKPLGCSFKEFVTKYLVHAPEPKFKKYEETGFGTPSGKVELYSSILEKLGYDPLPRFVEPPESPVSTPELYKEYPLIYFVGDRSYPYFQTQGRMVKSIRKIKPDPLLEIHPVTAHDLGILDGDWVYVETKAGKIKLRAKLSSDAHPKVVRVPHGWWFPEKPQGEPGLSGLWDSCDAAILDDKDEYCDPAQGLPCTRGLLCKVYKAE